MRLTFGPLIRSSLGPEGNSEAVPTIDGHNGQGEVDQLFFCEMPARGGKRFLRNTRVRHARDGFSPRQRGALSFGEKWRFLPRREGVQTLFGFALGRVPQQRVIRSSFLTGMGALPFAHSG